MKYYELTAPQKSIWLTEQYYKNTNINNVCGTFYSEEKIDFELFKKSLNIFLKNNDSFRIRLEFINDEIKQYFSDIEDINFDIIDIKNKQEQTALEEKMASKVFDMLNSQLFEIVLFRYPQGNGGFVINSHHIISDSWTNGLVANEVALIYSKIKNGEVYEKEKDLSYKSCISAEEEYVNSTKFEKDKNYWNEVFSMVPEIATIPSIKENQKDDKIDANRILINIDDTLLSSIQAYCNKYKVSLYNFFMSVFSIYLGRVSSLDEFAIGTPILNRTNYKEKQITGMFINTLPLKISLSHEKTFLENLKDISVNSMSLLRHQKYSYQYIIEDLRKRDSNLPKLYNVIFSYQITKMNKNMDSLEHTTSWTFNNTIADDLDIHMFEWNENNSIQVAYDYRVNKYDEQDIKDLHARILHVINQILDNEDILLKDIEIVTPEEKHKILYEFNNTKVNYPKDKTIVDLFEEQVEKTPDNIAVVFENQKLTYRELNEKANQLARYLILNNVTPQSVIGLRLDKSLEMIIGIIAIIKCGACYLPMNMAYPEDRVNYMLTDSNCNLILCSNSSDNFNFNTKTINIDLSHSDIYCLEKTNVNISISPEDSIYIIYTSGSTGTPKGAVLCHRNVVRLMKNDHFLFDFSENDTWTMFHSVAFDFSVWEMYGALLYGGKLVLIDDSTAKDPHSFLNLLRKEKVTILNQTPTYFYNLQNIEMNFTDHLLSIRYIIFGGEALNPILLKPWHLKYPQTKLINMYGITETTVHVTFKELAVDDLNTSTSNIGKPIPTLHVLVLDKNLKLLPFGTVGEMCVLGDGVFKGYLNREELNSKKLIKLPEYSDNFIYRSADSAIMHKNGDLQYIGRIDNQIKIRGFRVEIGEIENIIYKYSNIDKCIVCKKETNTNREILCAYYINNGPINIIALKKSLSRSLPNYMIPQYFIKIDKIPTNINGKTDYNALPIPNTINEDESIVLPTDNIENTVYNVYQSVLGIYDFSMNNSIYDLGGDSLTAISIATKLSNILNTDISVKNVLEHPILSELSNFIGQLSNKKINYSIINKAPELSHYPISSAQKRVYYSSSLENNSTLYNIAGGIIIDKILNIDKLQACFNNLISQHEALRTHFDIVNDEVVQVIDDNIDFKLSLENASSDDLNNIYTDFVKPFDLSKAPLFRVKLVKLNNNKELLLLDMHHIISDGTSLNILLQELCNLYNGAALPDNQIDYKDFTLWEKEQFEKDEFNKYKEYWVNQFNDEIPLLNMPTNYPRPSVQSFEGSNYHTKLSKDIFDKVNTVAKELNITPYMLMLSAYYILLSKYTSQDDIVVGTPIVGRELPELSNMLGMFVNTLALRNKIDHNLTFEEFSKSIKENCLDSFKNQSYPFDMLVKDLNIKRDTSRNPLFDVMFVYQNNGYPKINFKDASAEYFIPDNNISKFDLTLEIIPIDNEYSLRFEYCTKLFNEDFIKRLSSHYINILNAILENDEIKIADIDMLSEEEKHQILYDFNNTKVDYPKDKTIIDLFEEQVEKTPDNIAVVFEDQQLTYKQLNEKANQLARYLIINNVKQNDVIGILLPRSLETIMSMLAILKLGCAYMLIDTSLPNDRISYMLDNSNASLLITNNSTFFSDFENQISLDQNLLIYSSENINYTIDVMSPFAIIYTSGSTGTPKGVILTHLGVNNMVNNYIKVLDVNRCYSFISISSVAFDMFLVEVFITILTGKRLILSNEEQQKIPVLIHDLIKKYNVDFILTTPSRISLMISQNLLQDLLSLKIIQLGGEILKIDLYKKLSKLTKADIYNGYGPSEITACCSSKRVCNSNITIGNPFNNFKIYILNKDLGLCPIGIPGEICISGDGLALGYINNSNLTSKSFVKNPFDGTMMYKTGDLGLINIDNELEYIGRKDNQIKIHGLRIELSEIESKLLSIEKISDCAVIYKQDKEYLSAFIVSKEDKINISNIRNTLSKSIPLYMIPKYITQIDRLPITTNGKVDTKALYSYKENILTHDNIVKPITKKEKLCYKIWQELLGYEISITDNIFEVGADSLLAIKFKTMMLANNIDIPYSDIFKYPTIRDLCNKSKSYTPQFIDTYDYSKIDSVLEKNNIKNISSLIQSNNNNVLLLGSNGFVGMHILFNFLMLDKGNIYCIVRDKNNKLANDRFIDTLHFYFGDKLDKYINKRLFIIKGNILKENFDLSSKVFDIIKNNVNIVINSASLVKHYGAEEDFFNINIGSTKNIINFCSNFNKRLIHISSLSVSGNDTLEGNVSNDLNTFNATFSEKNLYIGQKITNLYVKSKFDAERLILENLAHNNLQAQILRLGNITNRFSDGKFQINPTENSFVNKLISLIKIGYIPKNLLNLYLEFTPVDICSIAIILIVQNYVKEFSIFHLYNDNHIFVNDFIKMLSKLDINLKVINEDDFKALIDNLLDNNTNILKGIINDFDSDKKISYSSNINVLSEFTKAFLYKIGFSWPTIDMEYISKYMQYLININLMKED